MKTAPLIPTFIPSLSRGRPRLYRNVTGYYPYGIAFADWRGEERYGYGGKEQDRTIDAGAKFIIEYRNTTANPTYFIPINDVPQSLIDFLK